jgi:hypothetical protein
MGERTFGGRGEQAAGHQHPHGAGPPRAQRHRDDGHDADADLNQRYRGEVQVSLGQLGIERGEAVDHRDE